MRLLLRFIKPFILTIILMLAFLNTAYAGVLNSTTRPPAEIDDCVVHEKSEAQGTSATGTLASGSDTDVVFVNEANNAPTPTDVAVKLAPFALGALALLGVGAAVFGRARNRAEGDDDE